MDTLTPDRREEDWNAYQDEVDDQPLPRRTRRQLLNRRTAALGALLTCALGFYVGVRVEKGQLASSSSTLSGAAGAGAGRGLGGGAAGRTGLAGLFAGGGRPGAAGGAGAAGAGVAGAGAAGAGGGFGGAGGFGGGAGGSASLGTVSSVNGRTLYLTETSGNTVKVVLSSATKISKTQPVRRSAIRPGDTVVVQGIPASGGSVSAASVTDSGTRAGGSGSAGASGSSGSGNSGSAVGSLFSSGG